MPNKGLISRIGELIDQYRQEQQSAQQQRAGQIAPSFTHNRLRWLLPTPGNVIFTLFVIGSLLWAQNVGAISLGAPTAATTSITGIPYQGRLADKNGAPLTQTVNMTFRLYSAASGGSPLWTEQWTGDTSVQVSDGLFNVMLGSITPIPQAVVTGNSNLFLGITVGTDSEMSPRVQLGSVPFATQALTVPDGSITTAKLADGAVTSTKLSGRLGQVAQDHQPSESNVTGTTAYQDKATVNLTTKGGPLLILASYNHVKLGPVGGAMYIRLTIDGVEKKKSGWQYNTGWTNGALTWLESNLQPGSHTFKLQYALESVGDTAYMSDATLTVIELGM